MDSTNANDIQFRRPKAGSISVRGRAGGVPQPLPASTEVPSGDQAAASPHHGVHPPPPLHLPLLRHVPEVLPREVSSLRSRPPGQLYAHHFFLI